MFDFLNDKIKHIFNILVILTYLLRNKKNSYYKFVRNDLDIQKINVFFWVALV